MRTYGEIRCVPVKSSVPAIRFYVPIEFTRGTEAILGVNGFLFTMDDTLLASVREYYDTPGRYDSTEINAISYRDNWRRRETKHQLSLIAILRQEAIDCIEEKRMKDVYNDVKFKLKLIFHIVEPVITALPTKSLKINSITPRSDFSDEDVIIYGHDNTSSDNTWLLSAKDGSGLLEIKKEVSESHIAISSSDWVKKFSEEMKLGKYFIIELPLPEIEKDYDRSEEKYATQLHEAIESFTLMEQNMKIGEWNEVIKNSRPIYELIREKDFLESILSRSGYTQEMTLELHSSIKSLFNYASKYIHKIDQSPEKAIIHHFKAEKEDAYLIYATSATLINLLNRKLTKTSLK